MKIIVFISTIVVLFIPIGLTGNNYLPDEPDFFSLISEHPGPAQFQSTSLNPTFQTIPNPFSISPGRQPYSPVRASQVAQLIRSRDPLQIFINGSDSTVLTQGSPMQITVVFSDGVGEADVNMWIDLNGDAVWDQNQDLDIQEPHHLVDNDETDENPAPGIYEETLSGSEGVFMVGDLGVFFIAVDNGGTATAFAWIEPLNSDYSVSGQVIPAFGNLIIMAMPLEGTSQEPWMTVTDETGAYQVAVPESGNYFVAMIDYFDIMDGMWISDVSYNLMVDGHLSGYDITLQEVVGAVTGSLIDQDDQPVEGIEIHAFAVDSQNPFPAAMVTTDADGAYTMGLYTGNWLVRINDDYLGQAYLEPPDAGIFSITPGDTVLRQFQIYSTDSQISGMIFLDDIPLNQNVTLVAVSALGSMSNISDLSGIYTLPVSGAADQSGGYTVNIDEYTLPPGIYVEEHYENVLSGEENIDFHLLTFTGGLAGHIFDTVTTDPLSGAQVHLSETTTEFHFWGISDSSGYYEIPTPPGNYAMILFRDGYYNQILPAIDIAEGFVEQDVYMEPLVIAGSIFGTVYEINTGITLPGVPVTVTTGNESSWYSYEAVTDSAGNYSFEVSNGTFWVGANLEGWTQLETAPVSVNDDSIRVDLTLAPLNSGIWGFVTDAVTGLPVGDSWVYGENNSLGWSDEVSSAQDGSYSLPLINGNYTITAGADDYLNFAVTQFQLLNEQVRLDIVLTPTIPPQLGDVNGDQSVNVLDVVLIVDFILGNQGPAPQQAWAADINIDGAINVLDVVDLVDAILNGL